MSTAAVIAIVIGVVVVLAAVAFFTLARRSDVRGAGALSGETVQRDKSARRAAPRRCRVVDRRDGVRRRGRRFGQPRDQHRRRHDRSRRGDRAVDATRSRGDRRIASPVLQPRHRHADERRHSSRSPRRPSSPSCGRPARVASVAWSSVGKLANIKDGIKQGDGFFYAAEARSWITEYPAEALPAAELVYPEIAARHDASGHRRSSARSARTSVVACRSARPASGSSASATARSTTASARRRPAPRRAAWTASRPRSPRTATSRSTPASAVTGPAIGTNTTGQEAEGPHCTGGGEHH